MTPDMISKLTVMNFLYIAIRNIWDRDWVQQCIMAYCYSVQVIMYFRRKLSIKKRITVTPPSCVFYYSVLKSI